MRMVHGSFPSVISGRNLTFWNAVRRLCKPLERRLMQVSGTAERSYYPKQMYSVQLFLES